MRSLSPSPTVSLFQDISHRDFTNQLHPGRVILNLLTCFTFLPISMFFSLKIVYEWMTISKLMYHFFDPYYFCIVHYAQPWTFLFFSFTILPMFFVSSCSPVDDIFTHNSLIIVQSLKGKPLSLLSPVLQSFHECAFSCQKCSSFFFHLTWYLLIFVL